MKSVGIDERYQVPAGDDKSSQHYKQHHAHLYQLIYELNSHSNTSIMIVTTERKNERANRFGRRNRRNFATEDSITPMLAARNAPFIANAPKAMRMPAGNKTCRLNPIGMKRLMIIPISRSCFIAEAISRSARFLPDCSNIIASCTMVSSRWVSGLSIGILAVSVRSTMTNGIRSSQREA